MLCLLAFSIMVFFGCQKDASNSGNPNEIVSKPAPKSKMDVPVITCGTATQTSINIVVTAGASGAPAGFSLQWMTLAAYVANGNSWSDTVNLCKGSFSGNANLSRYNLAPGESVTGT